MQAIEKNSKLTEPGLLVIVAITIIGLEVISALLAYETVGAVASALYWAAIGVNLCLFPVAFRSRFAAAIGIVALGLILVPYQFVLAGRLWRVQTEATRIVAFAYESEMVSGAFPTDLAGYEYTDSGTKPFIHEYRPDPVAGGFNLCYWVGTKSTSHCYSPKLGWTFYPD